LGLLVHGIVKVNVASVVGGGILLVVGGADVGVVRLHDEAISSLEVVDLVMEFLEVATILSLRVYIFDGFDLLHGFIETLVLLLLLLLALSHGLHCWSKK